MQAKARQIRSQIGVTQKLRPDDTETLEKLRRDFRAARLEEHIQRTLETFPPLTQSQADRLAALLRGGSDKASERSAVA